MNRTTAPEPPPIAAPLELHGWTVWDTPTLIVLAREAPPISSYDRTLLATTIGELDERIAVLIRQRDALRCILRGDSAARPHNGAPQ
jgi:hypothetical protein